SRPAWRNFHKVDGHQNRSQLEQTILTEYLNMNAELLSRIIERRAVVGVIGLGYVGLPLAGEFGRAGFTVIGFEVDTKRIEVINKGESYIPDVPSQIVQQLV